MIENASELVKSVGNNFLLYRISPSQYGCFDVGTLLLVESHPFCTTVKLKFYRPLCYSSRPHCLLRQCLRTTSAILAGVHSYFAVSSFKCEGDNSCHDLIPNSRIYDLLNAKAFD